MRRGGGIGSQSQNEKVHIGVQPRIVQFCGVSTAQIFQSTLEIGQRIDRLKAQPIRF